MIKSRYATLRNLITLCLINSIVIFGVYVMINDFQTNLGIILIVFAVIYNIGFCFIELKFKLVRNRYMSMDERELSISMVSEMIGFLLMAFYLLYSYSLDAIKTICEESTEVDTDKFIKLCIVLIFLKVLSRFGIYRLLLKYL